MTLGLHAVAIYNPDLLAKHELVQLFIARRPLLERLVRDLRDETEGLPQHHLIVGRRGMGKTTLLRRLRYAIEDDPELDARWLPLVFPEEQYNVASLSDFWLNCVDALADSLEAKGQRDALQSIDEQVNEIAGTADEAIRSANALKLLLTTADRIQRRLVLMVDNVDFVFARLEQDDWSLREVLSREPRLMIIGATSQALESSFRYDKAFYDFFRLHALEGLDEPQTFEIMRHLATITKQPQVLEVIDREPGRIQTLRLLSGGNPRTLVLLFNLLSQGTEGDARSDLDRLLDQITPLYKHRCEELSAQAQRVVDGLALNWDPMTARDLADRLRLDVNQTSAQLNRLVKQGVVEKIRLPGNKRTGFQLAERIFNIWYLMRASRRMRRRLVFLVKFLELFFPTEALGAQARRRIRGSGGSLDADYGLALAQVAVDTGLRHALETHSLRALFADPRLELESILDLDGEDRALGTRAARMKALSEAERAVLSAKWDWPAGLDGPRFWELLGGSLALFAKEKRDISVADLTSAQLAVARDIFVEEQIEWAGRFSPDVAESIHSVVREGYVDIDFALDDINSAVEVCDDAAILPSLLAYKQREGAGEWTAVDQQALDASIDCSRSHWVRVCWGAKASHIDIEARLKTVEDADPSTLCSKSSYDLGRMLASISRFEEAELAFRRAIELDPNDAFSWNGLGNVLQSHLSRFEEAELAYRRAIELDPNYAYPWNGLGNLLHELSRFEEAEFAYRRAIELDPKFLHPWYGLAWHLYIVGGDLESAGQCAQKAVDGSPDNPFFTHTLSCIQAAQGKWPAEMARHFLGSSSEEFRQRIWDDILRFFAEVVRHDHAAEARALLEELEDADAWAPLIAALDAAQQGSVEILLALSPEMRQAAELVLARIAPTLLR